MSRSSFIELAELPQGVGGHKQISTDPYHVVHVPVDDEVAAAENTSEEAPSDLRTSAADYLRLERVDPKTGEAGLWKTAVYGVSLHITNILAFVFAVLFVGVLVAASASLFTGIFKLINLGDDPIDPTYHYDERSVYIDLRSDRFSNYRLDAYALLISLAMTILTEVLNYLYAAAIRGSLSVETKLEANSHLRLFTSLSGPRRTCLNPWSGVRRTSLWLMFLLVSFSYTASSLIAQPNYRAARLLPAEGYSIDLELYGAHFSYLFMAISGACLAGQLFFVGAAVQGIGLRFRSTNAVESFATMLSHEHNLVRNPFYFPRKLAEPVRLVPVQPSLIKFERSRSTVRWIVRAVWLLALICLLWLLAMVIYLSLMVRRLHRVSGESQSLSFWTVVGRWNFFPNRTFRYLQTFRLDRQWESLFVKAVVQLPFTFVLQLTDLIFLMIRDEMAWREADPSNVRRGKKAGRWTGGLDTGNILSNSIGNRPSLVSLLLKSVIQWAFGKTIIFGRYWQDPGLGRDIKPNYLPGIVCSVRLPQVLNLFILQCIFAGLVTYAACYWTPKGYLPATYGNFREMIKYVDTFCKPKMYWGDKTEDGVDEPRTAGFAASPADLKPLQPEKLYAVMQ